MNIFTLTASMRSRDVAYAAPTSPLYRMLLLLISVITLSVCTDSIDGVAATNDIDDSAWEEHACEMAVPEGLAVEDFACGTFTVPADWDYPEGESLSFEVAVLRARDSSSEPDPFVFLGGGPGAWNLEGLLYREASSVLSPIAERRDIVFLDKRGNGLSNPSLFCPEYFDQFLGSYSIVADAATDAQALLAGYQDCHTRLTGNGVNLSNFNSYQVASDLTALMEALGYQTYNLYGISTGSLTERGKHR